MNEEVGGYDAVFVHNINMNDVRCAICLLTLREPVQANPCGHRFCKSCIERIPGYQNEELICPSDRRRIKVFPDVGKEREILNLHVKCSTSESSCDWIGELRDLKSHLQSCVFAVFSCEFAGIGCKSEGNRQYLTEHIQNDIGQHMALHMKRILQQDDRIKQQELEIIEQRETIAQQNEVIVGLLSEVKTLSVFFPRCPFTFVIENFSSKFALSKINNDIIYSDSFYYLNGYRARLKVYLNGRNQVQGSHISVYFQIMRGPFDKTLIWPMVFGLIKISLIINDKCKHKMAINCKEDEDDLKSRFIQPTKEEGEAYGTTKYFAHKDLPTGTLGNIIKLVVDVTRL